MTMLDEPSRANELTRLKPQAIERGVDPAKLDALGAELGPDRLAIHLEDWRKASRCAAG